jgi:predicted nucleic acid-binding protein
MRVIVQDASIIIDLAESELLEAWFSLGIETLTTSLVWREVNRRSHKSQLRKFAKADKLQIVSISAEAMTEVVVLRYSLPPALTLQDASVLHLAQKSQGILLAGDDLLRKAATERNIAVHGQLWVLDQLVEKHAITPSTAGTALERLLKGKSRLPKAECDSRIKKWRS